jgi:DNA-binding response OmpR family regulator
MDKVILLIDDDSDEHDLFIAAIERIGSAFTFLSAAGTDEAMIVLQKITPDFIFLDINMPAKNGFACLQAIKHNDLSKNVPVEMYSTSDSVRDKTKAIELGACGYLVKTNSFIQLCNSVKDVLTAQKVI